MRGIGRGKISTLQGSLFQLVYAQVGRQIILSKHCDFCDIWGDVTCNSLSKESCHPMVERLKARNCFGERVSSMDRWGLLALIWKTD